jgi:hypothetical protein
MLADEGVWVQLATRIPKTLHRNLKLHVIDTDSSIMEFVARALEEKLARGKRRPRA